MGDPVAWREEWCHHGDAEAKGLIHGVMQVCFEGDENTLILLLYAKLHIGTVGTGHSFAVRLHLNCGSHLKIFLLFPFYSTTTWLLCSEQLAIFLPDRPTRDTFRGLRCIMMTLSSTVFHQL